jgi:hypothetical protein
MGSSRAKQRLCIDDEAEKNKPRDTRRQLVCAPPKSAPLTSLSKRLVASLEHEVHPPGRTGVP